MRLENGKIGSHIESTSKRGGKLCRGRNPLRGCREAHAAQSMFANSESRQSPSKECLIRWAAEKELLSSYNHDGSPRKDDGRDKDSWSNLANHCCCQRLEDNICDEENEDHNRLSEVSWLLRSHQSRR